MAMLALRPTSSSSSTTPSKPTICTPNLLPTRINHNGPINNTQRHWAPEVDSKGTAHVHFRGRHLHGTTLPLPTNYTGYVLKTTDEILPRSAKPAEEAAEGENPASSLENRLEEEEEVVEEVRVMEQMGSFEGVVVWGHGAEVGEGDEYMRGMNEWVGFAEGVHWDSDKEEEEEEEEEERGQGEGEKM